MWPLLLLAVLILGYLLYKDKNKQLSLGQETDDALEELRIAYARGDLSDEEFEKRRDRLERER